MDNLISVIIPIYNMEQYLSRCLDSVLENSYRNLEVICIDDGSTDDTPEILRSYAEKDSRIVVVCKENGGVSSARNVGLELITGDYISFVDPDDFIHPQYFELLLCAIKGKENHMAVCGFRMVEDKDLPLQYDPIVYKPEETKALSCAQLFKEHDYRSYIGGRLIPAKLLLGLRFREDLSYSEDSLFIAELAEKTPSLVSVLVDEKLYYYYQRDNSLGRQPTVSSRYLVTDIFMNKSLVSEDNESIFLDQALKGGLSTRYYATHFYPDRLIARKCTKCLKSCLPILSRTTVYSRGAKALYSLFICFPGLYWIYRSIKEPFMWKWEQVERRKRREEKKKKHASE